jgi:hypothetical protein
MRSARPCSGSFTEDDLAQLEWVLHSVYATKPFDEDARGAIRRMLFALACNGMNNPEELRDHLVKDIGRLV